MKHSIKVGLSFGVTSGIITTLGLMIGLHSSTNSSIVVIGGILTIAIADSLSDALGIHISEEAENIHTESEIWESTISTFIFKFIIASSFVIPLLVLELTIAIIVNIFLGLFLLCFFSFNISKNQKTRPLRVVSEHLIIAIVVIIAAYYIGYWISVIFY